jgi:hypothetical protein
MDSQLTQPTQSQVDSSVHRIVDSSVHRIVDSPVHRIVDSSVHRIVDSSVHLRVELKVVTITKEDLRKLNTLSLRRIPTGSRYAKLRSFVGDECRTNLSNVIRRPVVPSYLTDRYGSEGRSHRGHHSHKTKAGSDSQISRGATRRKLVGQKTSTESNPLVDQINDKIRDILSKLSENNKSKLFGDFRKCEIPDECGPQLISNVYTFAIDLDYLNRIYAELIILLQTKNALLYQQLIEKIITHAHEPMLFEDDLTKTKRWRIGNIKLISALYQQNAEGINLNLIASLTEQLLNDLKPEEPEPLEVLCELIKGIYSTKFNHNFLSQIIRQLKPLSHDHAYEIRYRFMIQDLLDLLDQDESGSEQSEQSEQSEEESEAE